MDDKLFKEKLSELTEWVYPRVADNGGGLERMPTKEEMAELVDELGGLEELDLTEEEVQLKINDRLGPVVIKILHPLKACEDCGKMVAGRVLETKQYYTNRPHWRKKCAGGGCGLYENPMTGQFDVTGKQSQALWARYTNNRGKYKSKYQPDIKGDKDQGDK
jgi:hypothetical protein